VLPQRDHVTYGQFLSELGKAGLKVHAFAALIGMNPNSVSNYARGGEVPRHLALIAVLLAEMTTQGVPFRNAMARVEVTPMKPRGAAKRGRFGGDKQARLELDQ
jgi:hypothetical protein